MRFSFHEEAEIEFFAALDYYDGVMSGLGEDFAGEMYLAVERILGFPDAWPLVDVDIRRCLLKRFPYGILYTHENEHVYILAVMHLHREPEYWKHRVQ